MSFIHNIADRLVTTWNEHAVARKVVSFALVGAVNAAVDFGIFFLAREVLRNSASVVAVAGQISQLCCLNAETWIIIPANVISWLVAVSNSYMMNSFTTFAAESGRKLRWRDYGKFVASGIAGVIANTTTVVFVSQFVPLLVAKLVAIMVGFVVNFSLSHFVVFRTRAQ